MVDNEAKKPPRRGSNRRTGVHISGGYLYLPESVVNNLFGKPPREGFMSRVFAQFAPGPGSHSRVKRLSPGDPFWDFGVAPSFDAKGGARIRILQRLTAAGLPRDYRQEYIEHESEPGSAFLTLFLPVWKGEQTDAG